MKNKFSQRNKGSFVRTLFTSYELEIRFADGSSGKNVQEVYLYFNAKSFANLMQKLFKDKNSIPWAFMSRKLRKDVSGNLAMVMAGYEEKDNSLLSAGIVLGREELMDMVTLMESPERVFHYFYKEKLGDFLAMIEGVWVFLFLCKESGYSDEQVLSKLKKTYLKKHLRQWGLKQPLDIDVLSYFSHCYAEMKHE